MAGLRTAGFQSPHTLGEVREGCPPSFQGNCLSPDRHKAYSAKAMSQTPGGLIPTP